MNKLNNATIKVSFIKDVRDGYLAAGEFKIAHALNDLINTYMKGVNNNAITDKPSESNSREMP